MTNSNTAVAGRNAGSGSSSPVLRFFAHLISYIFHPLFVTTYVMGFLIFVHPFAFDGFEHKVKVLRFLHILLFNCFFPLFSVFLLWRLNFVSSMQLRTVKDRIIPYLITMIFYWWSWNVFKNLRDSPPVTVHFLLGAFLAICGGWLANIYFKISMHAIAMGGALMFFFLFSFNDAYASGLYLSVALLATGLVLTSRLLLGAHSNFEIWSGLFVGLLAQYVAWQF